MRAVPRVPTNHTQHQSRRTEHPDSHETGSYRDNPITGGAAVIPKLEKIHNALEVIHAEIWFRRDSTVTKKWIAKCSVKVAKLKTRLDDFIRDTKVAKRAKVVSRSHTSCQAEDNAVTALTAARDIVATQLLIIEIELIIAEMLAMECHMQHDP